MEVKTKKYHKLVHNYFSKYEIMTQVFVSITNFPVSAGKCDWFEYKKVKQRRPITPREFCCENKCGKLKCGIKEGDTYYEYAIRDILITHEVVPVSVWSEGPI